LKKIKTVIFDLGGVVINLHVESTLRRFSELSGKGIEEIKKMYEEELFFKAYERGIIDDESFRRSVCIAIGKDVPDELLDDAWNDMLKELPLERINWIKQLAKTHKIAILSNTNAIHVRKFEEIFTEITGYSKPNDLFHHVYYSNEVGHRKPDLEIFLHALADMGAKAEETLFLDDIPENLDAARVAGINTKLVERNNLTEAHLPN